MERLEEKKQKGEDEHNISAHKRRYSEKKTWSDKRLSGNVSTGNKHSQLRYPECNVPFHHWIFTKTRILRHQGKASFMHVGHFAVRCHELGFRPRDLRHFLHVGDDKHQLFLKGTENTLLHTAISRSWLWVWIRSQGVCFLFTVPRALHLHELCHRNRSTAAQNLNASWCPELLSNHI